MNSAGLCKTATIFIVLVISLGCSPKEDKRGSDKAAPQEKIASKAETTVDKPVAAPPQDAADARTAAQHVLAQFETGDFGQIYKDASPGFKKLGSEAQFVTKFMQTRQKTGVVKNPKEASFKTLPGNIHVLVFRMENEQNRSDVRLTFARAQNGKMELGGLNQHDEPKK
jgi:hypothetical protein